MNNQTNDNNNTTQINPAVSTVNVRFSSAAFSGDEMKTLVALQEGFTHLGQMIENSIQYAAPKAVILTKLEESYMWTVSALKDAYFQKIGAPVPERTAA
jgi:hypothetical protein